MKVLVLLGLVGLALANNDTETRALGSCPCGRRNSGRIVGGTETKENEYPWMVGYTPYAQGGFIFCGGALISTSWTITAAHCTEPQRGKTFYAIVGEHNIRAWGNKRQVIRVAQTIEHEQYNPRTTLHDIALVKLWSPVTYSDYISPVCLPSSRMNLLHQRITVIGWGRMSTGGTSAPALRHVDLDVIPLEQCRNRYPGLQTGSSATQICTHSQGKDSCQGDSGGPLVWTQDYQRYILVAVVSYGRACASAVDPAVNTDTSAYISWIVNKLRNERTCHV